MKLLSDNGPGQKREANISLHGRTDFMMRKMEPSETLTEKLLSNQTSNSEEGHRRITDPLIQGLMERLPSPDSLWPIEERAKWLRTAANIFDLVYKARDGEQREITLTLAK